MKTIFTRVPYFCTYYCTVLHHSKVNGSSVPPTSFSYTFVLALLLIIVVNKTVSGGTMFILSIIKIFWWALSWAKSVQSVRPILFHQDPLQYYPIMYAYLFQVVSFHQICPTKPSVQFCCYPYMPDTPLTLNLLLSVPTVTPNIRLLHPKENISIGKTNSYSCEAKHRFPYLITYFLTYSMEQSPSW